MDEPVRVDLARLDGRLDGVVDRLDRQETACERRSGEHVDQRVYDTERRAIREELATIRDRLTDLDARQRGAEKLAEDAVDALDAKYTAMRRHAVTTLVAIAFILATVGLGVLT